MVSKNALELGSGDNLSSEAGFVMSCDTVLLYICEKYYGCCS